MSLYNPKLTGGSNASAGFEYQDYCALIALFLHCENTDFLSLTIETLDDFTLLYSDFELLVQVKKHELTVGDAKNLLSQVESKDDKKRLFICTSFGNDMRGVLRKKLQLKNSLNAGRKPSERNKFIRDYKEELRKFGLAEYYNKLMACDFIDFPESHLDAILYYYCGKWCKQTNRNLDLESFTNELLVMTAKSRSTRDFVNKEVLNELARKHFMANPVETIIEQLYNVKFKHISEVLRDLGESNESVLGQLESKIIEAHKHIENNSIPKALEIYDSIGVIYPRAPIFLQCAQLRRIQQEYDFAIKDCEKALAVNPNYFDAYFLKGVVLLEAKRYDESIASFKKAKAIQSSAAVSYYMGTAYMETEDFNRAIRAFRECVKLEPDTAPGHFLLSICYEKTFNHSKSMLHIDRTIDLDEDFYPAYLQKGDLLRFLGVYDDAIPYYKRYLMEHPENRMAVYGMAIAGLGAGLPDGLVYFSQWAKSMIEDIREQPLQIVDVGWKETFVVSLELTEGVIEARIGEYSYRITPSSPNNYIFIMCTPDASNGHKAVVGKTYSDRGEFNNIWQLIKKSAKLQLRNDHYEDPHETIQVRIEERDYYSYIEMDFGEVVITGTTDPGDKRGLYGLVESFEQEGAIEIWITTTQWHKKGGSSSVINSIRPIRRVSVKLLDKEAQAKAARILERHNNLVPKMEEIVIQMEVKITSIPKKSKKRS
jgi:tetratricopeptide (TPR) repeat protein